MLAHMEESTRVHEILTFNEDRSREKQLNSITLTRDVETLKIEINGTPSEDYIVSILKDFLEQS